MRNTPVRILAGDVLDSLRTLPDGCVQCCVTSPPYWGLRDYGVSGQIGLEPTPEAFIEKMVAVFAEVRRVLREDGTLWLNIGDSYAGAGAGGGGNRKGNEHGQHDAMVGSIRGTVPPGLKPKDLCMMPWRVALALQADGWYLRSVIVWAKKSPMPESVRDRPTSSWEPIFLMSKSERYFYDAEAVKEASSTEPHAPGYVNGAAYAVGPMDRGGHSQREQPDRVWGGSGRNLRNVWHLGPEPYSAAHFATFPSEIPRRAILAGTSEKGCCPECGAGWERVLSEAKGGTIGASWHDHGDDLGKGNAKPTGEAVFKTYTPPTTIGWKPTCQCKTEVVEFDDGEMRRTAFVTPKPVPCVVLDPFLGSGTTIAVARQLGRHGIGGELNPEYVKLAEDRIGKAEKPHTYASKREDDSPLWNHVTNQ